MRKKGDVSVKASLGPALLPVMVWALWFAGPVSAAPPSLNSRPAFVSDEILVRLRDDVSGPSRQKALALTGTPLAPGRTNFFKIKLKPGLGVKAAVEQMKRDSAVLWAQPNYRYYASAACLPPDTYFNAPENWPFLQIHAPEAWGLFAGCPAPPPGSSSVTVAVIDSGVSRTHPDITVISGYNAITNKTDLVLSSASEDDFGHGTYVTGIIAAQWNVAPVGEACGPGTTQGMAGMAPGVKILPVKVLDNTGTGTTDSIVAGTNFAVSQGARVLNYSLGSSPDGGIDPLEKQALDDALANNCVIVAAAGNESGEVNFPAAYPPVIAVGATDPNDQPACYSNFGPGLDLMAPGGSANNCLSCGAACYDPSNDIFSAILECPAAAAVEFNRMTGGGADFNFGTAAGTSASAPFVTGAAALVLSMYPALTNTQIANRLMDNADSLNNKQGWDPKTGYGRLNIYRALLNTSPEVTNYLKTFNSPNPFYVDVDITTNITMAFSQAQAVELFIYDSSGETVLHKNYAAGDLNNNPSNPQYKSFYVPWDGRNGNGQIVKTGVYFYSVQSGALIGRNKIALIQGSK